MTIKKIFLAGLFHIAALTLSAQVTVEQCVGLARENYPLIRKYDLLRQTEEIELSDINKGWLPQIGVYGQGTFQNVVPEFPDVLSGILDRMGTDVKGLGKFQYKAGLELNQTIWDGGASGSRRKIARARNDQRKASLEVELYAVRERVENLFFSILLIDEQIRQSRLTQTLLESNLSRMKSMKENGTAMQCDVDMLEAQCLTVAQQIVQASGNSTALRRMLTVFTGRNMEGEILEKPSAGLPADMNVNRPELALLDAREQTNGALLGNIRTSLMPRIGFFAQGYYGYPGFDYFKSMMNRDLSLNLLTGIKVSWDISPFYTRGNRRRELQLSSEEISVDRDVFLFNTEMQTRSDLTRIRSLQELMQDDRRIVELRGNVRKAAEARLDNGVIDATDLLSKITDENQARLTAVYHEIQLIQSIYQLKYTLNR